MTDTRPTPAMVPGTPGDTASETNSRIDDLRHRLAEGTEHLSDAARARVIAARERAVRAQRSARRTMHDGSDAATDLFDRQPLVIGALAFALGAAVAALLPKTRTENSYLGAQRDALMDEAERIFQEESSRARAALDTAQTEMTSAARDVTDTAARAARSAVDDATEAAKDAAHEVETKARSSAKEVKAKTKSAAKH
ncbi:hypothetical protein [Loktanella sp. 3ANDIMAR09]|uniref:hypothetical protein n=1 Tax=Loktanella sp. 3ANDIMAR09 TaxID=1225657 RepID=UPI000A935573|nr:hypothetical protein [Loktanella sp. 3ANDIMAR09]